jgi:single-stranded-DNA-specific exonuclease
VFFRIEKMIKTRWKFREPAPREDALALADSLNISVVLAELLLQRNVKNFLESKSFFRPTLEELHDPFLMDGMEEASTRTIEAITCNQKIVVYGDYDVDGTCASSIMYMFLKHLGADVKIYIPNRLSEGYGLSTEGIDFAKENDTDLIITVDCGITAIDEVDYANSLGIDVIITDHHQPKDRLPNAFTILDPIKPGDTYPFKFLAGAGVAFKLARAIGDRIGKKDLVMDYVDLVALASAADIVPLVDENRTLVRAGLDMINQNPRPGIAALLQIARMTHGNLSSGQIVFTIAPRINAVGRLGDAMRAVDLFTSEDHDEARKIAEVLEQENLERRKIDEVTFSYALDMVHEKVDFENDKAIILHGENWHPGVIGIVASRLVEKYNLPSIMLTTIDGVAKGSARSIQGFDIYAALEECKDLLIQFGGHKAAAGLEIEIDKIDLFREKFNEVLNRRLTDNDVIPEIDIDAEIHFSEITAKFIRILDQFAPFGPGNHRPVFLARDVKFTNGPRIVGKNHLMGMVKQVNSDKVFDVIGFNLGGVLKEIVDKDKILMDIVFTIDKFYKWDKMFPQLKLKDIRIKQY